ncbi:MAG: hypothetical protein P4L46_01210, partial [Fimbriimonas sp.]|nr:hypothetical protein [Fimbriimonas sp.]
SLPPVEGIEVRPRRSSDVSPASVLEAYGKAVGGDGAHPITGLRFEGTCTMAGVKSKVDATASENKYTFVVHGAKGDNRTGSNGTLAWFTTEKGIQPVPVPIALQYVNQRLTYTGPASLPKLENTMGATAKLAGKDTLVVSGTDASRVRVSMYFDKATGLLVRISRSYPSILGSMAKIDDFSNYRRVAGTMLPMKIVNHDTEGDTEIEYRSAKVDNKLDPTSFDPPKS